jgi:hypothetical protein
MKILVFVCFSIILFAVNNFLVANEQQLPLDVRTKLEDITKELTSISLVWKQQKSSFLSQENLLKKLKQEYNYGFLEPHYCIFMWQNGNEYLQDSAKNILAVPMVSDSNKPLAYEENLSFITNVQEKAFDGKNYYLCAKSENNLVPIISKWILSDSNAGLEERPLFPQSYTFCAGLKFPSLGKEIGNSPIAFVLEADKMKEIFEIRNTVLNNQNTLFVKIKSNCELDWDNKVRLFSIWLLPEYNYSPCQIEIHSLDEQIVYRIENSNFRKLPNKNIFLPYSSIISYYIYGSIKDDTIHDALFKETYTLSEVSTKKINLAQFDLMASHGKISGTLVGDRTLKDTDEGLLYVVPANPADLDRVIETALTGGDFVPTPLPSTTAIVIKWLLCIAGIAMIFYAGYKRFIKK